MASIRERSVPILCRESALLASSCCTLRTSAWYLATWLEGVRSCTLTCPATRKPVARATAATTKMLTTRLRDMTPFSSSAVLIREGQRGRVGRGSLGHDFVSSRSQALRGETLLQIRPIHIPAEEKARAKRP